MGLAIGADAVLPCRQRLAGQGVKRFYGGVGAAGFAGRDLQGLETLRPGSGSTTKGRIVDERLRVTVLKRAEPKKNSRPVGGHF